MGYVLAIVSLVVVFFGPAIAILRSGAPLLIRLVWAVLSSLVIVAFELVSELFWLGTRRARNIVLVRSFRDSSASQKTGKL